jgi:unsaturated rhamnogalacturonyl hydrolase
LGLSFLILNDSKSRVQTECKWIDHCIGQIFGQNNFRLDQLHIDMAPLAYAALRLDELMDNNKYHQKIAAGMALRFIQSEGAEDGTIPYTFGSSVVLVDTIGFLCPFLARFGRIKGDDNFTRLAVRQIDVFLRNATDPESGWVSHAFERHTRSRLGLTGWGRGVGWLLLGMTDTLLELDDGPEKARMVTLADHLLEKLALTQRADGHWSWNLTVPDGEADSSLTSLVAYTLSRLISELPGHFNRHADMFKRCRVAINHVTTTSGQVGQASGEAGGIGTYSAHFGSYFWALGPAVAADRISSGICALH